MVGHTHRRHAAIFKVLGVETRLRIIELLKQKGPICVNDLASDLGVSPSAVSQHLKVLKLAGLVQSERQGYFIPYDVNPAELEKCGQVIFRVCSCECCAPDSMTDDEGETKDKLAYLRECERSLRKELEDVQARIDDLKKKK